MNEAQKIPQHVAIIMDGNGRWARSRRLPHILGHRAGVATARRIVEASNDIGIKYLTLYTFSSENWSRPRKEISKLMGLLGEFIRREEKDLCKKQVRVRAIGRLEELPEGPRRALVHLIEKTSGLKRMTLTLALSYGGRQEIVDAVRRLAGSVAQGDISPEQIDEEMFSQSLYAPEIPDPDLVIRTSGETRLSNFLLWQTSYAELYVTPKYWPDFSKQDFLEAIAEYQRRERRFGNASGVSMADSTIALTVEPSRQANLSRTRRSR